jgi:hypothetical protein
MDKGGTLRPLSATTIVWSCVAVLAAVALAASLPAASAQTPSVWSQDEKLAPDTVGEWNRFPRDIAIDEDHLVVGNALGDGGGEVLVYDRGEQGRTLEATIPAPEAANHFGASVDLDGDRLAVGASMTEVEGAPNTGSAAVYEETNDGDWQLVDTVTAAPVEPYSIFGAAIGLEDDVLAVGQPDASEGPNRVGALHVFEETGDGFVHAQLVEAPSDRDGEILGFHVDVHEGTVYASGPEEEGEFGNEGAVFLVEDTDGTWAIEDQIDPPSDLDAEMFATSFAIDGDRMLVGAPGAMAVMDPDYQAKAFVYERSDNGWQHAATLEPTLAQGEQNFARSVALDGDSAFLGSHVFWTKGTVQPGTVAVFQNTAESWLETQYLTPTDPTIDDMFGRVVAAHDGLLAIGAPGDPEQGVSAGAAYLFTTAPAPFGQHSVPACANAPSGLAECLTLGL